MLPFKPFNPASYLQKAHFFLRIFPYFPHPNSPPRLHIIFEVYNGLHHVGDGQNGAVAGRSGRFHSGFWGSSKPNSEPMVNCRWFQVTFLFPSGRSLKLWKGHLTIPKRSQRIAKWWFCNRILKGGVVIPLIFPKVPQSSPGIFRVPQEHPLPLDTPP